MRLFNRSSSPPLRASEGCQSVTKGPPWFMAFLFVMLLFYWLFAVYFERMDLTEQFAEEFPLLPQNPLFVTIREMFTLQVMRHLIPVVVGWWLANEAAVSVVEHLYNLPDGNSARRLLRRLQSSTVVNETALVINPKTLEADRAEHVLLRVGGPGKIKLPLSYVGVTEMNDRFCRVLPPGKNSLKAFEYLKTVIDLRQQDRFLQKVDLVSLDGIPFDATVNIVYRIKTGEAPTQHKPYPYDETAVRLAAYAESVTTNEGIALTWEELPAMFAASILKGIVRKYTLDQIFFPVNHGEELYEAIQSEYRRKVYGAFSSMGLESHEVHVVNMELSPEVKERYIAYWQSQSDTDLMIKKSKNKAAHLEKLETARTEAEETMINAILEGVNKARKSDGTVGVNEIVMLRLVEALEKMSASTAENQLEREKYLPTIAHSRYEIYEEQQRSGEDTAES